MNEARVVKVHNSKSKNVNLNVHIHCCHNHVVFRKEVQKRKTHQEDQKSSLLLKYVLFVLI